MTPGTILAVLFILLLVGAFPTWGYSRSWGYGPSGILGIALAAIIVLIFFGQV